MSETKAEQAQAAQSVLTDAIETMEREGGAALQGQDTTDWVKLPAEMKGKDLFGAAVRWTTDRDIADFMHLGFRFHPDDLLTLVVNYLQEPGTSIWNDGAKMLLAGLDDPLFVRMRLGPVVQEISSISQPLGASQSAAGAGWLLTAGMMPRTIARRSGMITHLPERPGWSLSQYDLSLASQLVSAGVADDQLIANMIAAHRAHHGEHEKTWRPATSDGRSYAELTIAKARAPKQVAA